MGGRIYSRIDQLVGGSPVLELVNIEAQLGLKARVLAKLEYFQPAGSTKDRVAKYMLDGMEADGRLKPGGTVIEPTSGNTGIGLACLAAARGYRAVIVMPDTMSKERQLLMRAYGAQLVLSDGALGMAGAIALAEEIRDRTPGAVVAGQFDNPDNPRAHYETTGPEIWEDTGGNVDIFVAGVGTGGTITGAGRYLKERDPNIKVVAVEPAGSPVLSGGKAGPHGLQGIGAGFVPSVLDTSVYDEIVTVTDEDAYQTGRSLGEREGVLVGITSGAAAFAAVSLAKLPENEGKTILALLPDGGERYLSTPMFSTR